MAAESTDPATVNEINSILKYPKDFYKILNLSKECNESEIKKAYRKLARLIHPGIIIIINIILLLLLLLLLLLSLHYNA